MNVLDFKKMKQAGEKISMLTCYDYSFAQLIAQTAVDCILVGDSLAMVMHGHPNTITATIDLMCLHTRAVAQGMPEKFIIGDLPFLSYRKSLNNTVIAVQQLMQAGAHAVKLEGTHGNLDTIKHLVESGVPVMGHIGLTPQAIHNLGGHRIQGKQDAVAADLLLQAQQLEQAGCFAIVLECIPATLAKTISQSITIPTIGIGAGPDTDGQVLVLQDLLGMQPNFKPKFLKTYLDGVNLIQSAVNQYVKEVKTQVFPAKEHCY